MPSLKAAARQTLPLVKRYGSEHALGTHVNAVRFVGGYAAAALGDGMVRFFLPNAAMTIAIPAHKGAILCASLATNNREFLTGGDDGRVCRISPDGAKTIIEGSGWIDAVASHPSGAYAFATRRTAFVHAADGEDHKITLNGSAAAMAFSLAGQLAIAERGGVTLIGLANETPSIRRFPHEGLHLAVAVSADERFVVSSTYDCALHTWRLSDDFDMHMSGYVGRPRSLSWSADGRWLASSGATSVVLWPFQDEDGPLRRTATTLARRSTLVVHVTWHPRKSMLSVGYADGALVLVQKHDGLVRAVRDPDGSAITDANFDESGRFLAYGTEQGTLGIVDLRESA